MPVTLIVPFPPGGVADIVARPFADALGASSSSRSSSRTSPAPAAASACTTSRKAKPDGYTVLLALSSISIIPEADKVLGREPMYQLNQLVPIARFTADPTVLAVRADSPGRRWRTSSRMRSSAPGRDHLRFVGQLRHDARADGDVRSGREPQVAARAVHRRRTRGGRAARRQCGCAVDRPVDGHPARARRARCACSRPGATSASLRFPTLPTLKELGYDAVFFQWSGLFAPAGTPEPVIARLREASRAAAADARFTSALATVRDAGSIPRRAGDAANSGKPTPGPLPLPCNGWERWNDVLSCPILSLALDAHLRRASMRAALKKPPGVTRGLQAVSIGGGIDTEELHD